MYELTNANLCVVGNTSGDMLLVLSSIPFKSGTFTSLRAQEYKPQGLAYWEREGWKYPHTPQRRTL